jgi:predicted SnoaL-like aldol condensation-catalyzing enzyme
MKTNNLLDANKEVIRNYFKTIDEAGKTGNAEIIDNFLSEDFIEHNPFPGIPPNREGWKQLFKMFAEATPGYHVIDDLIAEDDKVVAHITAFGKHVGNIFGIPATNREFSMEGIVIWRLKNGKITEHWAQSDMIGMMSQLGVMTTQSY